MEPHEATRVVTKAPPWHGWVTADLFLSSLGAGTFAVGAICLLAQPGQFAPIARAVFVIVLPVMLCDLACLIADLGDPARFHHMLRVFKPGSPMSVGVWTLSIFSVLAFLGFAASLLGLADWVLEVVAAAGLMPALVAGAYKGVLFSATAQPGWRRMRWLGAALSISSAATGLAVTLVIAGALGGGAAARLLRLALAATLVMLLVSGLLVRASMRADPEAIPMRRAALAAPFELFVWYGPLVAMLPTVARGPRFDAAAAALVLLNAVAFRHRLVIIPHRVPPA